jgi:hypothetical protein
MHQSFHRNPENDLVSRPAIKAASLHNAKHDELPNQRVGRRPRAASRKGMRVVAGVPALRRVADRLRKKGPVPYRPMGIGSTPRRRKALITRCDANAKVHKLDVLFRVRMPCGMPTGSEYWHSDRD